MKDGEQSCQNDRSDNRDWSPVNEDGAERHYGKGNPNLEGKRLLVTTAVVGWLMAQISAWYS